MKMLVGLKMEKIGQRFCLQALNSGSEVTLCGWQDI